MTTHGTTDSKASTSTGPPITGSRVRPLTLRLVLALALFPIVPSSTFVLMMAIDKYWTSSPGWFDELQFWMLSGTVAVTLVSLYIWRACVVWTAGRYAGTVIATAVPIAQVLWWQPLWQVGCGTDMELKVYQSTAMVGIWVWMAVWVWWGWARLGPSVRRRLRMSEAARRVLLSLGSLPFVVGGYLITFVFFEEEVFDGYSDLHYVQVIWTITTIALLTTVWCICRTQRLRLLAPVLLAIVAFYSCFWLMSDFRHGLASFQVALVYSNLIWAPIAMLLWSLVWRPVVLWNPTTRIRTCWTAVGFLFIATLSPFLPRYTDWLEVCQVVTPVMAWGGWMIATMLLWRFREVRLPERVEQCLRCSSCGYSLRGLYGTRCPECGEEPTLDELVAGVLGADDA